MAPKYPTYLQFGQMSKILFSFLRLERRTLVPINLGIGLTDKTKVWQTRLVSVKFFNIGLTSGDKVVQSQTQLQVVLCWARGFDNYYVYMKECPVVEKD